MKEHLVFLTENGDYSELSARLVSGNRGNSPGNLRHFWPNTKQERWGIIRAVLKGSKQRNGLAPSTFWHMRRYLKIWHPKLDSREMIGSRSVKHAVIPWVGLRFTFHLHFSCPASQMTNPSIVFDDDARISCGVFACASVLHDNVHLSWSARSQMALSHDYSQRVTTIFFPRGWPWVTNCSYMILRKTSRQRWTNVFGLYWQILNFPLEQELWKWFWNTPHRSTDCRYENWMQDKTVWPVESNPLILFFTELICNLIRVKAKSYWTVAMILRSMPGLWPYESFFGLIARLGRKTLMNQEMRVAKTEKIWPHCILDGVKGNRWGRWR